MAVAVMDEDESNAGINFISLPSVDLRDFCGDELRLVAQFSGHFPDADFCDIVVPKIDRSCFNESAGSRKQTYNNRGSSNRHRNRGVRPSAPTTAIIHERRIGLTNTSRANAFARLSSDGKVTEKGLASQVVLKRVGPVGGIAENVTELFSRKKLKQSMEVFNESECEGAMRRRNRKRACTSRGLVEEGLVRAKRRRGSFRDTLGGALFESRQLEFHQRPVVARKRIGEGDMMERLARMKGKWSCSARTRKIVDASGFPVGWTVRVGLRYKDGRTLFEYRDWRSPDGILWSSFKDASAFLLSSLGHHPTSEIVVLLKHGQGSIRGDGVSAAKKESTNETVCDCNENLTGISSVAALMDSRKFCSLRQETSDETDAGKGHVCNENLTGISSVAALMDSRKFCSLRQETSDETDAGKGHVHGELCNKQVSRIQLDQSIGGSPTVDKARTATEVEVASHADKSTLEGYDRQLSNNGNNLESGQSACDMRSQTAFNTSHVGLHCRDHMAETPDPSKEADLKESSKNSYLGCPSGRIDNILNSVHSKNKVAQCCSGLTPCNHFTNKCSSCGMMFSTLFKLRGHLRRADHGRDVKCDVCSRHFSSIASLFSHRMKMGHPRVARVTYDSRRVQAKRSEPGSKLRRSKMFNIVLGLLSDSSGDFGCDIDHASVSGKFSKSTENLNSRDTLKIVNEEVRQHTEKNEGISDIFECKSCGKVFYRRSQYWGHLSSHSKNGNLRSKDILKVVNKEVRQHTEKNGGLSDVFECRSCDKVFSLQSQYWGHLSSHSKRKKKALKPSGLVESVSTRSLSKVVGSESNVAMVVRENRGCEAEDNYAVESVFWKLLDDSSPLEGHNHDS